LTKVIKNKQRAIRYSFGSKRMNIRPGCG